jgi:hypothetical protein
MSTLPQPIHVALVGLVLASMYAVIQLAQRLGEWRSKIIARILGIVAGLLGVCALYLISLWIFGVDLRAFTEVAPWIWWSGGIAVSTAAILAIWRRRPPSSPPDLASPRELRPTLLGIQNAGIDRSKSPELIGSDFIPMPGWMKLAQSPAIPVPSQRPSSPPEPLSEDECCAVWSDASTADVLYLAIRNGTPRSSRFIVHLKYVHIWSLVQHRYVDVGHHFGLYSFEIFDSHVTPDQYGNRRVIEKTGSGFRVRSTDADRQDGHSEYGKYKLGLSLALGERTRLQDLCLDFNEGGLSKSECFGDGIYATNLNYLDEIESTRLETPAGTSAPPFPESTTHEN